MATRGGSWARIAAVAAGGALVVVLGVAAVDRLGDGDESAEPAGTTTTTARLPAVAPEIAALADRTTMTPAARQILYESEPRLVDKAGLATACPIPEATSVLGCFRGGRIAVLRVDDPRLDGMQETTAAHEVLHAAWSDLTARQHRRLRPRLRDALAGIGDQRLREKVETYRRRDPDVVDTELHSILGTEVATLPPDLERYYARWFTDRASVVALAAVAQSTFTTIEAEVQELDAERAGLRAAIEQEQARLAAEAAELGRRQSDLERLERAGRVEEYNAAVPDYNARVAAYNDAAAALEVNVALHNANVRTRNALAAEHRALVDMIATQPPPAPPQL
jgi:hypothetical protein